MYGQVATKESLDLRQRFLISRGICLILRALPKLTLLRNALNQTRFKGTMPTEKNWRPYLRDAVHQADWKLVYKDVVNFLENPKEMDVFTKKNVLQLIGAPRE